MYSSLSQCCSPATSNANAAYFSRLRGASHIRFSLIDILTPKMLSSPDGGCSFVGVSPNSRIDAISAS